MNIDVQNFLNFLSRKGIQCETVKEMSENNLNQIIAIKIFYTGQHMPEINMRFSFAPFVPNAASLKEIAKCDLFPVFIRTVISRTYDENIESIYAICSKLNSQYRWVSFYVDSDNDILASASTFLGSEEVYEGSHDLILKMFNIVDRAYPEIMKALWST